MVYQFLSAIAEDWRGQAAGRAGQHATLYIYYGRVGQHATFTNMYVYKGREGQHEKSNIFFASDIE